MKLRRIREVMAETRGKQVGVLEDLPHFGRSRRVGGRGGRFHPRFDVVAQPVEEAVELDPAPVAPQDGRVFVDPPQSDLQLPRLHVLQPLALQRSRVELAKDVAEMLGLVFEPVGDFVEDAFDFIRRPCLDDDGHLRGVFECGRRIFFPMLVELGLRIEQFGLCRS